MKAPWLGILLAALGCADALAASGCEDLRGGVINPRVSWSLEVKPLLVEHCRGCHDLGQRPDFSDYQADPVFKLHVQGLLTAKSPETSPLFLQVDCSDPGAIPQMPLGQPPLARGERELLYDWISQGAVADPGLAIPDGSPYAGFVVPAVFVDSFESIRR